jgi:hypothetical protein
MSHELTKQFVPEAKSNTARTFSSPSIDSTRPDTTFRALYYYNLVPTLTALATATCSTRSQCHLTAPVSSPPQYKHTSPPHPPLPSRRHTSLSARGEARVSMNPHPLQRRGPSVISGLNGPCPVVRNKDQVFGLRCVADGERSASRTKFNPGEHRPTFSPLIRGNSPACLNRQRWMTIKTLATAWCSMVQESGAGLGRGEGAVCQSIWV